MQFTSDGIHEGESNVRYDIIANIHGGCVCTYAPSVIGVPVEQVKAPCVAHMY